MIQEDESMEISRRQSKINRDERLASEKRMIRLFTPTEEDILRNGLKESELQDVGDRMVEDVEQIVSKTFYGKK